ncbi:asparagine synthase-related protein [Halomonas sp. M5N1S17]|uniref:asparagine synthase-related protein n=1 Tax=Halomonas alkalisoli TaxID=2907158 RepID=UPI001F487A73|nr:asparagine synthase-related protein [Halomonas alkalisoli]MCE9662469.1 asparagine synthase-related protein [Halomonas alkalisoli]
MSSIHCHFSSPRWTSCELADGQGHLCGTVWQDGQRLSVSGAAKLADPSDGIGAWRERLSTLNGFHALVRRDEKGLVAMVDRIRSIPIFYGMASGALYLSDDADWVRSRLGQERMSQEARADFQLAGYVTGRDTLFQGVKQLRAGEALVVHDSDTGLVLDLERYYLFQYRGASEGDEARRQAHLEALVEQAFRRLIDVANGRQIVVPLSGGYDSRLVATMLARLGYPRVLTYAYGHRGNPEAAMSRQVAESLELPWTFVEYSQAAWREAAAGDDYWHYQQWASGWSSITNMQDWLAVKLLTERGDVEPGAVFVPGHCCVTGFLPPPVFEARREGRTLAAGDLGMALRKRHFALHEGADGEARFQAHVLPRLAETYPVDEALDPDEFIRQFILFGWQERQAKFIVNTVRSFEFFGHDWWMPLYDGDFMAFWQQAPGHWLEDRSGYVTFVERLFAEVSGRHAPLGNAAEKSRQSLRARLLRMTAFRQGPGATLKRVAKRLAPGLSKGNTAASTGRFPPETFERLKARGYTHNGIAAQLFLERFS